MLRRNILNHQEVAVATRRVLEGLRIIDLTSGIAGPYCTKLFVDAGAEVIKLEPPSGDPLRSWSATGLV